MIRITSKILIVPSCVISASDFAQSVKFPELIPPDKTILTTLTISKTSTMKSSLTSPRILLQSSQISPKPSLSSSV